MPSLAKLGLLLLLGGVATAGCHKGSGSGGQRGGSASASASATVRPPPTESVFTEAQLFNVEKRDPLVVWSGSAEDGSRKTVEIMTADAVKLRGWFVPAPDPAAPYVLTFRGNNETIADATSQVRDGFFYADLGFNLVTFDYRGTGFSEGTISLERSKDDALAIFDEVMKRAGNKPVFVCGWSLGSVFASHIAGSRSLLAGLILLGPLASIDSLKADVEAQRNVRITTPPSFALIQNDAELRAYTGPLLVVHGAADPVVPIHQGRLDFEAAASKDKTFVPLEGRGHSGAIWSPEADAAIAKFLKKLVGTNRAAN